jgi:DNA-binding response OmpR family regulator
MKKRVLVIDDDEMSCDELTDILEGESYEVDQAFDGLEAEKLLEEHDYDVVLLDLTLPGLSGIELLRRIKAAPSGVGCIVVTGRPLDLEHLCEGAPYVNDDYEVLKLADGVMQKPVDIEGLLERVRVASGRRIVA